MPMTASVVIDKVRKLRSVAQRSTNQNEAHNASLLAQRLLAEHHLADHQVGEEVAHHGEPIVHVPIVEVFREFEQWEWMLAHSICTNLRCSRVYQYHGWDPDARKTTRSLITVGRKSDVMVAIEVYQAASEACARLADDHVSERKAQHRWADIPYSRRDAQTWRDSFTYGFYHGLDAKFRDQVKQLGSMALVLVAEQEVKDKYDELTKGFGTARARATRTGDRESYGAGRIAGSMTDTGPRRRLT